MRASRPFFSIAIALCFCISCFLSSAANATSSSEDYYTLSIGDSKIRGVLLKDNETSTPVVSFRGLRYAEAPIGDRRWKAPVYKELQFDPLIDATQFGSACPQTQSTFLKWPPSEDCLFLNIWTPNVVEKRPSEGLLPVMFFIHGGAFYIGSGHDPYIDGTRLAALGRVVVVSVNYRLGFFGFLSHPELTSADPQHPTNFGLLDQRAALQWLQWHIALFGGNPSQITIFGESAGAMSVMWHLVANKMKGAQPLFHRAIVQSSAANYPASPLREAEIQGKEIAKLLKCDVTQRDRNKYKTELECLRSVPMEAIVTASILNPNTKTYRRSVLFHSTVTNPHRPMPVVDGVTFPLYILDALEQTKYDTDIDVIIGTTEDEGTLFSSIAFPFISPSDGLFRNIVDAIFSVVKDPKERQRAIDVALQRYYHDNPRGPKGEASRNDTFAALSGMLGHIFFTCPTQYTAQLMADKKQQHHNHLMRKGKVYNYLFAVKTKNLAYLGSFHASELPYVFGSTPGGLLFPAAFSPEESKVSRKMIQAWSSFAATGIPKFLSDKGELVLWPEFDSREEKHLTWTNVEPAVGNRYAYDDCEFWKPIYNKISYVNIDELALEPWWSLAINGYVLAWLRYNRNQFLASVACLFLFFAIVFYHLVRACFRRRPSSSPSSSSKLKKD